MNKNNPFKGMGIAVVTPFTAEGDVDYDALSRLIHAQMDGGADFLCVLGTTAETPCLSAEEKHRVIRFFVDEVGGRVPLLVGAGGNCTASVVEYLRTEDFTGIDGVLIVTPYYNKPSQEGLYRHFTTVAAATSLPVVLYNVPGRTGVNLTAETTLRIAREASNVVAVKEASGKLSQIEEIIAHAPEGFEVLSGDDAITFELLTVGAVGVISVVGNAFPEDFSAMVCAAGHGNLEEALSIHRNFSELYPLLGVDGNPAGIKSLLALQGKINDVLRLPLVPASGHTRQAIVKWLSGKA